jgi:hypothetical protein
MTRKSAAAAILCVASLASATAQAQPPSQPVALRDAIVAPDYLRIIKPGRSVTVRNQCHGRYWSELSAYRWNGEALPGQRWNADNDRTYWGRVTFDGITWTNHYGSAVMVAGWCS